MGNWLRDASGETVAIPDRNSVEDLVASRAWLESIYADFVVPSSVRLVSLATVSGRLDGDLFAPVTAPKGPVVLGFHGGGWCSGSPMIDRAWNCWLAERGFSVWAPRYRLAPEHPFPAAVQDCAIALRLAREYAQEHGVPLILFGYSAGANLLLAAVALLHRAGEGLGENKIFLAYGIFDWSVLDVDPSGRRRTVELWNEAYLGPLANYWHDHELVSPINAVDVLDGADVLLACGDEDALLRQTVDLHKRMLDRGISSELHIGQGLQHSFLKDFASASAVSMREAIMEWVRR